MKVKCGAISPDGKKTIDIELDPNDMRDVEGFDGMTPYNQWKAMTDRGDTFVVEYLARRGDISMEFAASRIKAIKGIKDE